MNVKEIGMPMNLKKISTTTGITRNNVSLTGLATYNQLKVSGMPMLDISRLGIRRSKDRQLAVTDIRRACSTIGSFQVINHGVSRSVMEGALEAALQFFSQSTDEKAKLASEDIRRPVRYGDSSSGRNFLKHYAHPLYEWVHLWPEAPQSYREKMGRYAVEAQRVALQLIDAIMESLGLGEAYLKDKLERGMQVMTVNSYPHSYNTEPTIGLASHSDFGIVTILLQSCQGLQIVDRSNGHEYWRSAPYVAEALHVHIGDYLEVLSNGQYKSLIHRAVSNTEQRRFSISSIHGFSIDDKVSVPKELVDAQNPKRYRESSFRDFLDYLSNNGCSSNKSFIDELKLLDGARIILY